ncbi:hypothetical protein FHY03_004172 [Sphingomonas sp. BK345]|nr:hypothetical protein [Sphingomonas sp. BK345]
MSGDLASLVDVFGRVGLIGAVFAGVPFCVYMFASETMAKTRRTRPAARARGGGRKLTD